MVLYSVGSWDMEMAQVTDSKGRCATLQVTQGSRIEAGQWTTEGVCLPYLIVQGGGMAVACASLRGCSCPSGMVQDMIGSGQGYVLRGELPVKCLVPLSPLLYHAYTAQ